MAWLCSPRSRLTVRHPPHPTPTTSTPLVRQELAQRGLAPRVMELLKKPNALTCLSLLAVLKVMYENHPHPKVCARGSGAGGGGGHV